MRRFGGEMAKRIMDFAGLPEDVPLESRLVGRIIENAQTRVEGHNFDIRKHLLEYDDVVNKHRGLNNGQRHKILEGSDLKASVQEMAHNQLRIIISEHLKGQDLESWDLPGLLAALQTIFALPPSLNAETLSQLSKQEAEDALLRYSDKLYEAREQELGAENMRLLERLVLLRTIDVHWIEHLTAMENLRQGIGLQGVGQRDPLVAYKTQGHSMFEELRERIRQDVARSIYHVNIRREPAPAPAPAAQTTSTATTGATASAPAPKQPAPQSVRLALGPTREQKMMQQAVGDRSGVAVDSKAGRNDPCPCGSGKKYKKCHGA